jgi:hypothetical protein
MKEVDMFKRFRSHRRECLAGMPLLLLVSLLATLAVATPASASRAAIAVPFEKHWVEPGHYVGTAGDGGTIEMWVYDVTFVGNIQQFKARLRLSLNGHSLTAILGGHFNFSTAHVVLNGMVVDGWLRGAQVHEESRYTGDDENTGGPVFAGTVRLMPGSDD